VSSFLQSLAQGLKSASRPSGEAGPVAFFVFRHGLARPIFESRVEATNSGRLSRFLFRRAVVPSVFHRATSSMQRPECKVEHGVRLRWRGRTFF
jgi:hypothetical protein